jgi:hypothetical protein
MPAFMSGMGMRTQQPRRQFNQQAPGANQFTQALNEGAGTPTNTGATPNTAGQGPGTGTNTYANPYMANANPWTYDPQQGTYQPNSNAWAPEWMKSKTPAPTAPKIKQTVLKNYTPAYGDEVEGTPQQAADMLKAEAAKRGKAINIDEIAPKYAAQLKNGKVTGALYNQVVKDLFSEEEEVDDPNWKAPEVPKAPEQRPLPMNPGMGMYGMGGYMGRQPEWGPPGTRPQDMARNAMYNRTPEQDAEMRTALEAEQTRQAALTPQQKQEEQNRMISSLGQMQKLRGMGGMFQGYPGMQGGYGGY